MDVLVLHASTSGVTAVVVSPDGEVRASHHREVAQHLPRPGWVEWSAEDVWQATLAVSREVLGRVRPVDVAGIGVTGQRATLLLWDRETLGSPRPATAPAPGRTAAGSPACRLGWIAEHEPHTWALVEDGRYAVGPVESYLVARMTRGTWHVADVSQAADTGLLDLRTGRWSTERCDRAGVPLDALPEVVASWGEVATTDDRSFLGRSLPVSGLVAEHAAEHASGTPGSPALGVARLATLGLQGSRGSSLVPR